MLSSNGVDIFYVASDGLSCLVYTLRYPKLFVVQNYLQYM